MLKKFILIIFVLFLAVPTAFADDSSIIPVLWLFAQNGKLKDEDLQNIFKNTSYIYQYNNHSEEISSFRLSNSWVYQYNNHNEKINSFRL